MAGSFGVVVADLRFVSRRRWSDEVSRVRRDQGGITWVENIEIVGWFCKREKKEGR